MENKLDVCDKRNYGLDFLRILSMLMIIRLHAGSIGGLININEGVDIYAVEIWFIQILCVVSVNIFVLISGYFLSNQEFRMSRVFRLWMQTLFYSVLIYLIMVMSGRTSFTIEGVIHALFPVTFRRYWFITAYIGMSLLAPLINKALEGVNKTQHKIGILTLLIMTCIWSGTWYIL